MVASTAPPNPLPIKTLCKREKMKRKIKKTMLGGAAPPPHTKTKIGGHK